MCDDDKKKLLKLAFAFILVALLLVFMQVARVGYYREGNTVIRSRKELEKSLHNLVVLRAKHNLAVNDLKTAEELSANNPEDNALLADVITLRSQVETSYENLLAAENDVIVKQSELADAKQAFIDSLPEWRLRRLRRAQKYEKCQSQINTQGFDRIRDLRDCMKSKEKMCSPGLGPAECALLGQSGFEYN